MNITVSNRNELKNAISRSNNTQLTLFLMDGDYGKIIISNKNKIHITSQHFSKVAINLDIVNKSKKIVIENLNIRSHLHPRRDSNGNLSIPIIIQSVWNTEQITIKNCLISSYGQNVDSISAVSDFPENNQLTNDSTLDPTRTDLWIDGIMMRCKNGWINNNVIINTRYAIQAGSPAASASNHGIMVDRNLVQFFSIDGIRGIGHNVTIEANRIYNPVLANINAPDVNHHQDAIQVFPTRNTYQGAALENVIIRNNDINVQLAQITDRLNTCLQGIFASDGCLKNSKITGNKVIVNSSHGISINGPVSLEISDNRVELKQLSTGCSQGPSPSSNPLAHPGIKLNYTRTCNQTPTGKKWVWRKDKKCHVIIKRNTATSFISPNTSVDSGSFKATQTANQFQVIGTASTGVGACNG